MEQSKIIDTLETYHPLPQIHSRTLYGAAVLTSAVCLHFRVKPTSTAIPNTRGPTPRHLRLLASHP